MSQQNFPTLPIPQKPPFLFVDEVISISPDKNKIIASKKLTGDEDFFKGHFPGFPLMPGVLLCEAMLQSGAILLNHLLDSDEKIGVVNRVEQLKLKKPVFPGDTLTITVTFSKNMDPFYFMSGKIEVDNKLACSADFCCALVDRDQIKRK